MENITTPLGGIIVIDKVEKDFGLVSSVFSRVLSAEEIGRVKVLLNNKMTYATSVRQIPNIMSRESCALLGATSVSERSSTTPLRAVGYDVLQDCCSFDLSIPAPRGWGISCL